MFKTMKNNITYRSSNNFRFTIFFLGIFILIGFATFFHLASKVSEREVRIMWLYSAPRLVELIFVGILTILFTIFLIKTLRGEKKFVNLALNSPWKELLFGGGILGFIAIQTTILVLKALAKSESTYYLGGYASRLLPSSLFISSLGIGITIWVLLLNRKIYTFSLFKKEKKYIKALSITCFFVGVILLLSIYLRQNFKDLTFGQLTGPPVPLLEWQLFFAWALATTTMLCKMPKKASPIYSDVWIAIAIWAIATILWINQPINPSFAAREPMAPNFEIYPFSDAQLYAQNSQSIIIGKGMAGEEFPARPIYTLFLGIAHALMGQSYIGVVALQSLLLAIFPATLYLLGNEISGRPLGIAIAALAIMRDITTNAVASFTVSVTYSKLFLSELPTAALLSLFTLLSIKWIKNTNNRSLPIIAGGLLGIATLIRTQSLVVIAPVFLIALIHAKEDWKKKLPQFAFVIFGIALSLSPWLYRNWQLTGGLVVDNPRSQMSVFAVRYSKYTDHITYPHLPGENDSEYSSRMLKIALNSIYENPQKITTSVANHFFQNELDSLLVFPIRKDLPDAKSILIPTTDFWEHWDSPPSLGKSLLLIFYLLLFSIGITAAWIKEKWLALIPLSINIIYNLWTALFMASGIRFVFPVDWVFYLYQMLGLLTITSFSFSAIGTKRQGEKNTLPNTPLLPSRFSSLAIFFVFLVGISLPISEKSIRDQYPDKTQEEMWDDLSGKIANLNSKDINLAQLNQLVSEKELIICEGRAIYPRYFSAGEGFPLTGKYGYEISDSPRIVFELIGQNVARIVFPLSKTPHFFLMQLT